MKQLNLFDDDRKRIPYSRREKLIMNKDALLKWKQRIFEHQQKVREQQEPLQQMSLFDLPPTSWHTTDEIDPFSLRLHPADFWQWPEPGDPNDPDRGCIYFIIDTIMPIILYAGETKLTVNQRWSGVHYCKDYIKSYVELHRRYKLNVAPCSAFWYGVPPNKAILRKWERELIYKWCPPFNKECVKFWGKPFGKL